MSKGNKALKFGLISGGIIVVLWFLKFRIATPDQGGAGESGESESGGGGGGGGGLGGGGSSVDLSGMNHLANNLPGNQTPSSAATFTFPTNTSSSSSGPRQLIEAGPATLTTNTPTLNNTNVSSQLGFSGSRSVGFVDDERKLRTFL